MTKGKGNKRHKLPVIIYGSHGDVMNSTGSIVNNITPALQVAVAYWAYRGDHITPRINVRSLCCTPGTDIILYFNYSLIKHFEKP